ncbi:MAG: hypothetical protein ACJ8C4_12505 [Gemmataceae bacterium]
MDALKEIKRAISKLSDNDRAAFRAWFFDFDAAQWDRQIEADVATGRLDCLVEEVGDELRTGRCTDR